MLNEIHPGKKLIIVECPTNLGLSKKPNAKEPGVRKLPDWLKKFGFHAALNSFKELTINPPEYSIDLDKITQVRNADKIVEFAILQKKDLEEEFNTNSFLLLLGGDCSAIVGCSMALKRNGRFGIFYLDGHTDFIKPEQSLTHGAAGLALAIICGYGHSKLTDILNLGPYIEQQHVFCVGNREYDVEYERPLKDSLVNYFPLNKLRTIGIEQMLSQFFGRIEDQALDGFFIHFDVDVLNDEIMPAVDSRQPDGLSFAELKQILVPLLINDKSFGMEITILDPDLDPTGVFTKKFVRNITSIINRRL